MLSDKLLLDVFHYCLDASPRFWPRLVHIMSQVATYRICISTGSRSSTVLYSPNTCGEDSSLLASPAYRRGVRGIPGDISPTLEDEDNVLAALTQPDRVSPIQLTVAASHLAKL